ASAPLRSRKRSMPPLDPAAEPSAWACPDSPSVYRPITSSPRRVEDAPPARWRGPTQLATSPPAHDVDAPLRRNEIGGARTSGQRFDAPTDRIARVSDVRDPAGSIWQH